MNCVTLTLYVNTTGQSANIVQVTAIEWLVLLCMLCPWDSAAQETSQSNWIYPTAAFVLRTWNLVQFFAFAPSVGGLSQLSVYQMEVAILHWFPNALDWRLNVSFTFLCLFIYIQYYATTVCTMTNISSHTILCPLFYHIRYWHFFQHLRYCNQFFHHILFYEKFLVP